MKVIVIIAVLLVIVWFLRWLFGPRVRPDVAREMDERHRMSNKPVTYHITEDPEQLELRQQQQRDLNDFRIRRGG